MTDDRRVRLRRRLLVLGLLPLLVALALCVKVGVMLGLDDRGRSAFADGEFERAGEAFAANGWLNVFEPWVSPFDEGTADYRLADFATARDLLEEALLVVPDEQECLVRINLSLTHEALGDAGLADGRRDLAEAFWREGLAVLDAGGCRDRDADTDTDADSAARTEAVAARTVATRLAEKLAERASAADDPQPEDADPPTLEELEQRNEEAQEQRRKNEETRENDPPPDPTPTPTPTPPPPDDPDADPDDPSPPPPSDPPTYSW